VILAAVAFAISTSAPFERARLLDRWHQAAERGLALSRRLSEGDVVTPPVKLLHALADGELNRSGRYTLAVAAPRAPSNPPWWQRMWQWVGDRWSALWKAAFGRIHMGRAALASIGDATIVAIALLLVVVVLRLTQLRIGPSRSRTTRSRPLVLSAQDFAERANALAREGAYGAAARYLFSAMLVALDARGVVRDDRSSTVGEVRRFLLGHSPQLVEAFNDVAFAFVAGAYAERAVESVEWERALASYQSIVGATAS
jgi:hypothetical protein